VRTFAESYLEALEAAGRADPKRPRTMYVTFDEASYRRKERADDLATWHEMLLDRFTGPPRMNRWTGSPPARLRRGGVHHSGPCVKLEGRE
jgi:hypothetical protein